MSVKYFKIYLPGYAAAEADRLDALTPVQLASQGLDPGVVQYILDLRCEAEMWRKLFNDQVEINHNG